ncbi:metal-sulfur cluster assembly factor [Paenibacillaceae bacterium WGS1546]|uniref:metal-sulfur cluster assembly factor n=1 Tax=Cohnella sp. WGS1546 TaxID=3366810 RepID=UPI00372D4E26
MTNEDRIWSALEEVIDPELGASITDLGLVYDVAIQNGNQARIRMTLTIPECPLADVIVRNVKSAAEQLEGIDEAEVELVWEPKWTPAAMNDRAREVIRSLRAGV